MYIPAFLPCPHCHSGPDVSRDQYNNPLAECSCGRSRMSTWLEVNSNEPLIEEELVRLNIAWNEMILEIE